MQTGREDGQMSLFGQDGCAGKTCPAHSAAGRQKVKISALSLRRSSELKTIPYMSLDLTPGHGNLLGESYWKIISPSPGESSTPNTGPAPPSEEDVYSLSQILQDDPPRKYYLGKTACLGILRRARERGKELPPQLKTALMAQAGLAPIAVPLIDPIAIAANQAASRSGMSALSPQGGGEGYGTCGSGKQQAFIAQDCLTPWDTQQARVFTPGSRAPALTGADGGGGRNPAGLLFAAGSCAGAKAGSIGYQEEAAPALKSGQSGSAAEAGIGGDSQRVLCFENHGIDGRYTGPHRVSPTLTNRNGTGGNTLPLALQAQEPICISGNAIDRQPQNGGNGLGCQEGLAYTLTATDHHAVYTRQWIDVFKDDDVASTESARQQKDATDLICQPTYQETVRALTSSGSEGSDGQYAEQDKPAVDGPLLIRRLTPLECERLQGFPDFWTDLPGASDSSRYKALGNSVAIPCVEYIMRGIALVLRTGSQFKFRTSPGT